MNLLEFFSTLGIFSISSGQAIMIVVGLLLIYLAISKKFEPLLLLPIGFGALLTNIPEIGLSMSPIERMLYANNINEINLLINELGLSNTDLNEYVKGIAQIYAQSFFFLTKKNIICSENHLTRSIRT